MDGAGFEPAASTMPTWLRKKVEESVLDDFGQFLQINRRLECSTVKNTLEDVRRFLRMSNYVVSYENVKQYLESYLEKAVKTYNSQITSLRRFVRDFLRLPQLIMSFKMAPVDACQFSKDLPSKDQIRKGFHGLKDVRAKAIYLFTATTGLRKGEILGLLKSQVNSRTLAVIPRHFTRKKRSGVTFYNEETSFWLKKYLYERNDNSEKLFVISDRQWRKIWRDASENASVKITSKILRAWFSTEMGELGVPDRFVDIFQGRAARSVLAKHYTGKRLERLKRIYDKANLQVLKAASSTASNYVLRNTVLGVEAEEYSPSFCLVEGDC
jgi:integrase